MKKIFSILSIVVFSLLFVACKKEKDEVYYLKFREKSYAIESARALRKSYDSSEKLYSFDFFLNGKQISFNMDVVSGMGAYLKLDINVDSAALKKGVYSTDEQKKTLSIVPGKTDEDGKIVGSYFKFIPISKTDLDTIFTYIKSGYVNVYQDGEDCRYDVKLFDGKDSITGTYKGNYFLQNNIDGAKVGEVFIGDSTYNLQRGDIMLWGNLFSENLNYYELFFYSTDMRYSEKGKFQKGLVFVVGLHSTGSEFPNDGTYTLSRDYQNFTALSGRKDGTIDWGTYWYDYTSSSSFKKSFVFKNSITIQRQEGDKLLVTFNCTDQLGNSITGEYNADLRRIDLRKTE
ncbi:MAG: hypothetical protein J6P95_07490 [Paludibacteraceae bacterium]|nr:hypothetical protein [Paludibacteraceae bacterium]